MTPERLIEIQKRQERDDRFVEDVRLCRTSFIDGPRSTVEELREHRRELLDALTAERKKSEELDIALQNEVKAHADSVRYHAERTERAEEMCDALNKALALARGTK